MDQIVAKRYFLIQKLLQRSVGGMTFTSGTQHYNGRRHIKVLGMKLNPSLREKLTETHYLIRDEMIQVVARMGKIGTLSNIS